VDQAGIERLDAEAKAAYKRRLEDLRDELDEAERFNDPLRAVRAREEIDAIVRQLAAATGLGGRQRAAGSHAERARLAVTKRI
jgi:non-specific serine/threonine protein kinase